MASRSILVALTLVALAPGVAAAQFTTFVAPPKKVDTIVVADSALAAAPTADSLARASINNMKAWVDSAAGPGIDLGDTAVATSDGQVAAFSDGAPAPNTATPLPLLTTLGMGALGLGAWLLRRK